MPYVFSKSLILRKIPRKYNETDLMSIFSIFGEVRDIYIPVDKTTGKKKSYAFIEYKELNGAMVAHERVNTKPGLLVDGVVFKVDFAANGRQSPDTMRSRMPSTEAWEECVSSSTYPIPV
jgi:RNA recognition motif-containing protein